MCGESRIPGYYEERLSGERLRRCYRIAPPRVQRYLRAEVDYVARRIQRSDVVLELGCGYGRVMQPLASCAKRVVGVDTSSASLELAGRRMSAMSNVALLQMSAECLGFADHAFDVTVCVQNGLSAFGVDRRAVVSEAVRVTRRGGRVLLSSYAAGFWPDRLEWFRLQSQAGLLGEINRATTGNGVIEATDGFRAETISDDEFERLTAGLAVRRRIEEVDGSSLFCELIL